MEDNCSCGVPRDFPHNCGEVVFVRVECPNCGEEMNGTAGLTDDGFWVSTCSKCNYRKEVKAHEDILFTDRA